MNSDASSERPASSDGINNDHDCNGDDTGTEHDEDSKDDGEDDHDGDDDDDDDSDDDDDNDAAKADSSDDEEANDDDNNDDDDDAEEDEVGDDGGGSDDDRGSNSGRETDVDGMRAEAAAISAGVAARPLFGARLMEARAEEEDDDDDDGSVSERARAASPAALGLLLASELGTTPDSVLVEISNTTSSPCSDIDNDVDGDGADSDASDCSHALAECGR